MPRNVQQNNRVGRPRNTEVDAYLFIKENLKALGWDVRNPDRFSGGQVYTQNECLGHPEIQKYLEQEKPENVIKLSESAFWVIEAKREHRQIEQAVSEAVEYAEKINKSKSIKIKIISGVAGNEADSYFIKSRFFNGRDFLPIKINGKEISGLIPPDIAKRLLETNSPEIEDFQIDENLFISKAEKINSILHLGAINKNYRARVMAALLLSIVDETPPNIDASPIVLIQDINTRAKNVLQRQGKPEFFEYIRIALPSTPDNHNKFKHAIVQTLQELNNLNIRSAMNSGTDVLGRFYEVFLKYGNGAKEIGIVLTPRHITRFATEAVNVNLRDIVLDPTCGTGGFLVSAFDYIKRGANESQINRFKQNNLFGIEQEPEVVALAVVNMIFRGDGKNNLIEGNCFAKWLVSATNNGVPSAKYGETQPPEGSQIITKVLMNPPFALKSSDDKEYKFVDHALKQMSDDGILFSILPNSNLVKSAGYLEWRKELLMRNTLLGVVTFPEDLFYPIGVLTVGIFIKKGIPHSRDQKVVWMRALNDGLLKSKGKRLPNPRATNDFEKIKPILKAFINDPDIRVENIVEFQKTEVIDFDDPTLELIPEAYLDERKPTKEDIVNDLDTTVRETISFLVGSNREQDFIENVLTDELFKEIKAKEIEGQKEIPITELFETPIQTGEFHVSGEMDDGKIPLISTSAVNNGVEKYVDVSLEQTNVNAITIASDGTPLTSYYHYYNFVAKDNVMICIPKQDYRFTTLLYITTQLNRLRWRFSYGRKCYLNKVDKIKIYLPTTRAGKIDEDYIEYLVKHLSSWQMLVKLFQTKMQK